jgi:hypothetical protein
VGNSGWTADPNTIVIPANAGTGPRIVITSAPPETIGYQLAAAILFYWNDTDYFYFGIADFGPDIGVLVRGFHSDTTGTDDHFEEIAYANGTDNIQSQRYFSDYVSGATLFEYISRGAIETYADLHQLRYAPEGAYLINSIDDASAAQEVGMTVRADSTGGVLATFTTTEVVAVSITADADLPWGFRVNSRYLIIVSGRVRSTIAGDRIRLQFRQDNAVGTFISTIGDIVIDVANIGQPFTAQCLYNGRNQGGETVVVTGQRVAGTGTGSVERLTATAIDLGNNPQLVQP